MFKDARLKSESFVHDYCTQIKTSEVKLHIALESISINWNEWVTVFLRSAAIEVDSLRTKTQYDDSAAIIIPLLLHRHHTPACRTLIDPHHVHSTALHTIYSTRILQQCMFVHQVSVFAVMHLHLARLVLKMLLIEWRKLNKETVCVCALHASYQRSALYSLKNGFCYKHNNKHNALALAYIRFFFHMQFIATNKHMPFKRTFLTGTYIWTSVILNGECILLHCPLDM